MLRDHAGFSLVSEVGAGGLGRALTVEIVRLIEVDFRVIRGGGIVLFASGRHPNH
jgi:hypothetical protein